MLPCICARLLVCRVALVLHGNGSRWIAVALGQFATLSRCCGAESRCLVLRCKRSVAVLKASAFEYLQRQNLTKTSATKVDAIGSAAGECLRPPSVYGVEYIKVLGR